MPQFARTEQLLRPSVRTVTSPAKKIGLLDHLGHGNLGDDATLDAVVSNIRSRWPQASLIALTLNPSDTEERHGIPSYAIRRDSKSRSNAAQSKPAEGVLKTRIKSALSGHRFVLAGLRIVSKLAITAPKALFEELSFLTESFMVAKKLDLLVICGGGQLLDSWGGPWKFPYTLFKWILLAKLSGTQCYFVNMGAGPLAHPSSKWLIKRALSLADYVSFRDADSQALIRGTGFAGRSQVVADSAYSLEIPLANATRTPSCGNRIVGFSPMAYCDPRAYWDKKQDVYASYIQKLSMFGSWLIEQNHRLMLFSTDIWFDSRAIEDLNRALLSTPTMINLEQSICQPVIEAFAGLATAMCSVDYIVTSRYHGVVFAHMFNKPVLAISHHQKVASLMKDLGLSEYCVDIQTFDLDLLTGTFARMTANQEKIKARMAGQADRYKRLLKTQFDAIFQYETDTV